MEISQKESRGLIRAVLFLALFFGLFLWLLKRQGLGLVDFLRINPGVILAWFVFIAASWWINGQKIRVLLQHKGFSLGAMEGFQLGGTTSLFNYLPLQTGAALRAFYLKKRLNFPVSTFLSIFVGTYVVMFLVQSLIGLTICFSQGSDKTPVLLISLFAGLFLSSLLLAIVPFPQFVLRFCPEQYRDRLSLAHESFLDIFRDPQAIGSLIFLEIELLVIEAIKLKLMFVAFGQGVMISWPLAALMACLTLPSVLLNLTPAGIGIRESAVALVAQAYAFSVEKAYLAGGFDRLLTIVVVFTLGLGMTWNLMRKINAPSIRDDKNYISDAET